MSSLNRAISFIQVSIVSMLISENLNFNVSRLLHELLDDHMVITETLHCFSLSSIQLHLEFSFVSHKLHSFASSSKGSFEQYGEANLLALFK